MDGEGGPGFAALHPGYASLLHLGFRDGPLMQLFRYSTSIYGGSDVLIGASWDLLPWFAVAGAAVIVLHAAVAAIISRRSRAS
jgi:hypothetical protein